jgi:L-ascorbate metabolism protein UlaG (beta-lactamase superfamily)
MTIQKLGHSCFIVEKEGTKLLIDPGSALFVGDGFKPGALTGISAILITHEHPDHADPEAIKEILSRNNALVLSNAGVQAVLSKSNIAVELFEGGERQIGSFAVKAVSAEHGKLIIPIPPNTAYRIDDTFLVTGDSFDASLHEQKGISILALPIFGPWMKMVEAAELVKHIKPKMVIPVHDGIAMRVFAERQFAVWKSYLEEQGVACKILSPTDILDA